MNHKTAVFPGIVLRIVGIHQVLWYAHASSSTVLKLAERSVNRIVTSRRTAFPVKSCKVVEIGQALTIHLSQDSIPDWNCRKQDIVSLGRLATVKHLEECLNALQRVNDSDIKLINIGPQSDPDYRRSLERFRIDDVSIFTAQRELPQSDALREISQYRYYFSGTRKAIDKAAIEAASVGCLVLTTNSNLQDILNLQIIFSSQGIERDISKQLRWYRSLDQKKAKECSETLARHTRENLSLERVADRLLRELLK